MRPRLSSAAGRLPSRLPVVLMALVTSVVAACESDERGVDPASPTATEATELEVAPDQALDLDRFVAVESVFARVWNRVPAFSGFWYDDQGRLVVGLTDTSRTDAVVAALEDIGAGAYLYTRSGSRRPVVTSQAGRDFKTMINWKHEARGYFGLPGFHSLDYAEDQNRIVAEVDDDGQREAVADALREVGVPDSRFTVNTGARAVPTTTINDHFRPVIGGLDVTFERSGTTDGHCTLGFNADLDGVDGFFTAAHCTPTIGSVDAITFYQDTTVSSKAIGDEHTDPAKFSCSHGSNCRYSDASFFEYDSGVDWEHGSLVNIDEDTSDGSCAPDNFSIEKTIEASDSLAEITSVDRTDPVVGDTVAHLGAQTGQKRSEVVVTNDDEFRSGLDMWLLDQTNSEDASGFGSTTNSNDSGGPVYTYSTTCGATVEVVGIRWGQTADTDPGDDVWWTPIDNLENDFGSLVIEDQ